MNRWRRGSGARPIRRRVGPSHRTRETTYWSNRFLRGPDRNEGCLTIRRTGGPSQGVLMTEDGLISRWFTGYGGGLLHQPGDDAEGFMRAALEEARRGLLDGEVPVGAVVVVDGTIV